MHNWNLQKKVHAIIDKFQFSLSKNIYHSSLTPRQLNVPKKLKTVKNLISHANKELRISIVWSNKNPRKVETKFYAQNQKKLSMENEIICCWKFDEQHTKKTRETQIL